MTIDYNGFVPIDRQCAGSAPVVRNAMSVDVEDYFQVEALKATYDRSDWEGVDARVEVNTNRILDLFGAHDVKATFFTLGWVAQRFPSLIRRMADEGHEIASHGFDHQRIFEQTPDVFRGDIRRTKKILEDTSGQAVTGYRAATFSITERSLWAHEILAEEGHAYSSSIYPIKHDLYGMPHMPRAPFWANASQTLAEYPMPTLRMVGQNIPGGGGGYFRLLPLAYTKWAIRRFNRSVNAPFMFYFHPWEVDPDQPRVRGLSAKSRLRHYINLSKTEPRLTELLQAFSWGRVDEVYNDHLALSPEKTKVGGDNSDHD